MTIQVDFWHLVGLLLGFIGTLASFGAAAFRRRQVVKKVFGGEFGHNAMILFE